MTTIWHKKCCNT